MKIDHATNITSEITEYAYRLFKENYNWSKTIRSIGVRGQIWSLISIGNR
ncbi:MULTISPECIES: hypothetical protein [Coprococcus]